MCKIKLKIDGKITEIEVSSEIYEFNKTNFWQEDWRNRRRNQEYSFESIYENFGLAEMSAEEKYINKFEIEKLYVAIESLPEIQKRRIILRFFYNLKISQIADIEKCGNKRIEKSISRALKNLKKFLKKFNC